MSSADRIQFRPGDRLRSALQRRAGDEESPHIVARKLLRRFIEMLEERFPDISEEEEALLADNADLLSPESENEKGRNVRGVKFAVEADTLSVSLSRIPDKVFERHDVAPEALAEKVYNWSTIEMASIIDALNQVSARKRPSIPESFEGHAQEQTLKKNYTAFFDRLEQKLHLPPPEVANLYNQAVNNLASELDGDKSEIRETVSVFSDALYEALVEMSLWDHSQFQSPEIFTGLS